MAPLVPFCAWGGAHTSCRANTSYGSPLGFVAAVRVLRVHVAHTCTPGLAHDSGGVAMGGCVHICLDSLLPRKTPKHRFASRYIARLCLTERHSVVPTGEGDLPGVPSVPLTATAAFNAAGASSTGCATAWAKATAVASARVCRPPALAASTRQEQPAGGGGNSTGPGTLGSVVALRPSRPKLCLPKVRSMPCSVSTQLCVPPQHTAVALAARGSSTGLNRSFQMSPSPRRPCSPRPQM
jgi:hypothetical protein